MLEADYSAALALLLRYPVPQHPHGPSTFVGDALYLRDNLLIDGGDHIILKYSRRAPETTVTRKVPKKVKRARTAEQAAAQKALSPGPSPARFIHEPGGIEAIIQEAARGVYSRGEKWGVTKALRGAVQGLQSANSSPRQPNGSRWSLDSGKLVFDSPTQLVAKIQALEQRNKSLAKLLENAMDELWVQQKELPQKGNESVSDALSLAIAKVQFVQLYLENSTMPLPPEIISTKSRCQLSPQRKDHPHQPHTNGPGDQVYTHIANAGEAPSVKTSAAVSTGPTPSTPQIGNPSKTTGLSPFSKQRPALAHSSLSWMLGEDEQKSSFVSAAKFSSDRLDGRRKGNQLFGGGEERSRNEIGSKTEVGGEDNSDHEDVFTMGSLKAAQHK